MVFMLLSTVLTGLQSVKLLGRFGYGRRMQWLSALLTPMNAHKCARARRTARRPLFISF
jgi:hypothetical protein